MTPRRSLPTRRLVMGLAIGFGIALALANLPRGTWSLVHEFWTNPNFVVNVPVLHEALGTARGVPDEGLRRERLQVPADFALGVFAEGIAHPRMLRFTPTGDLLVSQPRKGRVLLLPAAGAGRAGPARVLLEGLRAPHGLEIDRGWLYVAETHAVGRVRFDAQARRVAGALERVAALTEGDDLAHNHLLRPLRVGPDRYLYTAVGSDCNVCEPEHPLQHAILRLDLEALEAGSGEARWEVYASGFRNPVSMDWRPGTGELYATEAGRDLLGDDFPPEELNRVVAGGFYGFPYAHGAGHPDPEFGPGNDSRIATSLAPAHEFGAHTTPLGIAFLRDERLPADYRGAALVALHGSWNRTRKQGYRVVSLHWQPGGEIEQRDFLAGLEVDEDVIGRPVDVVEGPDGAVYVSDDYAGAIYRIALREEPARALSQR